jgi:hypothetical protein
MLSGVKQFSPYVSRASVKETIVLLGFATLVLELEVELEFYSYLKSATILYSFSISMYWIRL